MLAQISPTAIGRGYRLPLWNTYMFTLLSLDIEKKKSFNLYKGSFVYESEFITPE